MPALANGGIGGTGGVQMPSLIPPEDQANYRSEVRAVTPPIPGLTVNVVDGDARLQIDIPQPREVFVVKGFDGEPFLRVLPDGFVEANFGSRTTFLVQERFARAQIPPNQLGPEQWGIVSQRGRVAWHDHRIHWMQAERPLQVTDEGRETKIFDWAIPVQYGDQAGAIEGSLLWVPDQDEGGASPALVATLVALASVAVVLLVLRGRVVRGEPSKR
jgi:hypothetical protein